MQKTANRLTHLIAGTGWALGMIYLTMNQALAGTGMEMDPSAPLEGLKKSRQIAQQSNMDMDHIQTTANDFLVIISFAAGVVGAALALYSWKAFQKNTHDGEQARGSSWGYLLAGVIGAFLTVVGPLIGTLTIYGFGTSSQ